MPITYADVEQAAQRITGRIRPLSTAWAEPDGQIVFALEFLQFTGTFKARGAQNFVRAHVEAGTLPTAGLTIASGGNAGLACAWAAASVGVPATVFLPGTAPHVKIARLRDLGAEVRFGRDYPAAAAACREFARTSGALASHAYDHPLIAAGAGTLTRELLSAVPEVDTVLVAVGGGGLFAGTTVVAREHGVRTVAVEPAGCATLRAALAAGGPVEAPVDSIAADSLGAHIVSETAYDLATHDSVSSVVLGDDTIVRARRALWDRHRITVEYGAATAYAALLDGPGGPAYRPAPGERVAVILCGANTDPAA